MKRGGTLVLTVFLVLVFLGGLVHADAHPCPHDPATPQISHVSHHLVTNTGSGDTVGHVACGGLACPMTGCCLQRIGAAEPEAPVTGSSLMPLPLAIGRGGIDPSTTEHPPKLS